MKPNPNSEFPTERTPKNTITLVSEMLDSPTMMLLLMTPIIAENAGEDKENFRSENPEAYYGLKSRFRKFTEDLKKAATDAEKALAKFH